MTFRDDVLFCDCGIELQVRRFAGVLRLGHVSSPPTIHPPRLAPSSAHHPGGGQSGAPFGDTATRRVRPTGSDRVSLRAR